MDDIIILLDYNLAHKSVQYRNQGFILNESTLTPIRSTLNSDL